MMETPHERIVSHRVPLRWGYGQGRVHVANQDMMPWHVNSQPVTCPNCDAEFIVSDGFFTCVPERDSREPPQESASASGLHTVRPCFYTSCRLRLRAVDTCSIREQSGRFHEKRAAVIILAGIPR